MNKHPDTTTMTGSGNSGLMLKEITAEARKRPAFDRHEEVWLGTDSVSGLSAIVAIHNSALGPGLGGTRFHHYATREAALDDVLRLSRSMSFKAAIAGLPFGGGKAVIMTDPATGKTPALLASYAEMLARLRGRYVTAEDVGMTIEDADFLRKHTDNVTGTTIGGSGNPAPFTARGVFLGIGAAADFALGSSRLTGRTVAIQGLGSVGMKLCELLREAGANLVVTDISASRADLARSSFSARTVKSDRILEAPADVFAPCALGAVIDDATVPTLAAGIVAGSANNVLEHHEDAAALKDRGILYAPDYVINAGGLINVAAELAPGGYDREAVIAKIAEIPQTLTCIFERARDENLPTNDVALKIAMERINAVR